VLAKCLNREDSAGISSDGFVQQVQNRMATVAEIYLRIVYQEQSQGFIDADGNLLLLSQVPPTAENSYSQIMQRLAVDAPRLLDGIRRADLSPHARRNLDRFLGSATTSSEGYAAVLRSPRAVEHALTIFKYSDYLTDILVRYPAEVTLLEEIDEQPAVESPLLFDVPPSETAAIPDPILVYLSQSNVDRLQAQALVRQQFRQALFISGARDLKYRRIVFEALKENTCAADKALESALAIADPPSGFAVMALGRLGSCEFDFLSDADVLFVANDACGREDARRAAERIMDSLTAYTRDGTVFPVDTRLRPQGREGELVTSPTQIAKYFARDAQPWEAISYLRLRWIAGDREVGEQALAAAREGIASIAQRPEFDRGLADMRLRLERSDPPPNLKTSLGGTFDIDFLAGRLQAEHQIWGGGNLLERIRRLHQYHLLEEDEYQTLVHSAEFLRTLEHFVRVVTGRPGKWLPAGEHAHECVARLMAGYDEGITLQDLLGKVLRRTRAIYLAHQF
jgi:glutamate-ammonia-ligase adenylyltransferase